MKSISAAAALLISTAVFSACTAVPAATNLMIDNRMNSALAGAGTEEVLSKYGTPHYRVVLPRPRDMIEIWGYDMGNYWVRHEVFLVFRNSELVGVSKHPYEMLQTLHSLRVFGEEALFSRLTEARSPGSAAAPDPRDAAENPIREKMRAAAEAPPKN